jgi:hypothetical protein
LGTVQPEVRPLPARLLLGPKEVGQTAEAIVVLQGLPGVELTVDHVEADSEDVQVQMTTVNGIPEGRAFLVTQRISKKGDQCSIVRFSIRKKDAPIANVPMEVCYYGRDPQKTQGQGQRRNHREM